MTLQASKVRELREREVPEYSLTGLDPIMARILATRGVRDAHEIDHSLAKLAPISLLGNIEAAVDLLLACREQRIVIVGDFDADGATSTALMMRCLSQLGFDAVDSLVPNRFDFGYGLSPEIVDVAARSEPALIVTVDNGISSVAGTARARELGIRVLITDHHLPPPELPAADVIINPNLPGDAYPSKNLAGVGVAFCLMAALARRIAGGDPAIARLPAQFLDLVALGTVADVVALDQNNRVLVEAGLQRIRARKSVPGIAALLEIAGRDPARIVATDLGFAVGPRLNAAGRLDDMSVGIRCLVTDSPTEAAELAATLDGINRQRRDVESTMQEDALADLDSITRATTLPDCICLYRESWHQGVVGLVASRIKEQVHRPVFAFASESNGKLKGSGRSISGIHIRDLLAHVDATTSGLIDKFGGHAMAAGLSLDKDRLEEFERAVQAAIPQLFPGAEFSPSLLTDGNLPAAYLSLSFAEKLRTIVPWGQRFPEPVFHGQFNTVEARVVGESHLKLKVSNGAAPIDAIAFNQVSDPLPTPGERLELAYRLDVNEWRSRRSVQLMVVQWRSLDAPQRDTMRAD